MSELREKQIETLTTLVDYMPRLMRGIEEASQALLEDKQNEAYVLFDQILEGYEWVTQAVSLTNTLHETPIDLKESFRIIKELFEALEAKDTITLSDLMQYELLPILEEWQNRLNTIRQ